MNVNWKMEADTTGWLDRSGKLHHCEYLGHWNKAREIAKEMFSFECENEIENLEDQSPMLNAAELLLEKGFVQIIDEIHIVDGKDTDLKIDKPVYAIHLAEVREADK